MHKKYYVILVRVSNVSIILNITLSIAKFLIGIVSNSVSVMADALHSVSDLITTVAIRVSLSFSRRPPDQEHPFGHGRIEDIGGLFVCFVLVFVGFRFFMESVARLGDPKELHINNFFIAFIVISAVSKLVLASYTRFWAQHIDSALLASDASHHYSDFFTSIVVGIGLFFSRRGIQHVDAVLGVLVSLVILFWAYNLGKEFIDKLIGRNVPEAIYKKIEAVALSVPNVENVHDIVAHSYGHNRIISLHVVVAKELSVHAAHATADTIEKKILRAKLGKCVVHVDVTED